MLQSGSHLPFELLQTHNINEDHLVLGFRDGRAPALSLGNQQVLAQLGNFCREFYRVAQEVERSNEVTPLDEFPQGPP